MKNFTNNFKQFTSHLSARWLIMALMMLVGTSSAWGAVTFTSDDVLFFNMNAVSWWNCGTNGNQNFAYFFNNSTNKNAWSAHAVQYSGNTYYVKIPAGTWEKVILTRNSVTSGPAFSNNGQGGNVYNQTGDITLSSTSNYISAFSENSASVTWGTAIKPTSTASLSASSTSVDTGVEVTLTPSLTSNTTYNEIKSTTYSISPTSGASISGNKFTATVAGTYTITATITYNPRGYSSLTSTTTATKTITVKALNNAGFWGFDAWNILYYSGVGYEGWIESEAVGKVDANATIDLGEMVSQPRLKGFITNVWKNKGSSDVCGVTMTFVDKNGTTQTIASDNQNYKFEWRDINNANGNDQEIKCYGLDLLLPCEEGENSVTFTFTARINNNGTGNCTETTTMTGTIKYTIPKCSVPDDITIQYANGEKFCANSNVTLSPSVEHVDGYTYAWVVSGAGWSINSGSAARECEVKVGTGEGSVELTVSNATCSKKATPLNITPKASTQITTPTISATKQIICNGNNDAFLSVASLTSGATYTLVYEGSEQADPAPIPYTGSGNVEFAISKAGSYTVVAKTTDTEACQFTARATNEIDFTSISFSQSEYTTTPWVPVSVVVNAPEGTTYEYDDAAITETNLLKEAPIKTVSNNTYTYKLPRPTAWGEGNKTPANADVDFTVSAEITVGEETCNIQSTVKLQDEGNDKCRTNP